MLQVRRLITILITYIFLTVTSSSCVDELLSETLVYSNNFSTLDLRNFTNARLFVFQGDTVAGFYHNEELTVKVLELPPHNALRITIDVLAHDSWDGNVDDGISGPDFWYFKIDDEEVYRTTFSNTVCVSSFCLRQSFPQEYFRQNFPKTGAIQTYNVGRCNTGPNNLGTTKYRVTKIIPHFGNDVKLTMGDELLQLNANSPLCDESWSVSKIEVSAMEVR
ncbi:hypothetical protein [Belliella pelovolcani]|jgi:hypothetical protein|uniref:Lipoprotein n=1 Tax=Belliella pelovolcani TaxID=529505 RepID=A0A1N7K2Z8_9BACT|nr:hypothetical protein [Belliella pelovolcani]SIS55918.1 hypothetical protein SAMN05421761_101403 [Belliella pelovolcani]